jgi:hypothetical protein
MLTELILSTHRVWVQTVEVGLEVMVETEVVDGHPGSVLNGQVSECSFPDEAQLLTSLESYSRSMQRSIRHTSDHNC